MILILIYCFESEETHKKMGGLFLFFHSAPGTGMNHEFIFAPHLDQIMYIDLRAALFLHGNADVSHPSTLNTNSSFS